MIVMNDDNDDGRLYGYLELIAGVDEDAAGDGNDVDPVGAFKELQAGNVVLDDKNDAAGVCVSAEASDEIRFRAGGVLCEFSAHECAPGAGKSLLNVALL